MTDGGNIAARLVVAADGNRSPLRAMAGIGFPVRAYGQDAVACLVRTELPHGNVARQRFLRGGPLAFLPLAEPYRCGIVWSTTPEHARALQEMEDSKFCEALASAFENTLGRVLESGPRRTFPLSFAHAERYLRGRLALAGDAAHCVHPLAGQGANLGLLDAAALAELVVDAHRRGRDPGAARVLRTYERWRRGENAAMGFALDALQKLFGPADGALPGLRSLGLDLVDRSGPLKHAIMRRAMGVEGDVPGIARGMPRRQAHA
jgi:2-octaprenylphenol hydroxylase